MDAVQLFVAQAKIHTNLSPFRSDLKGNGQQVGLRQVAALGVSQVQRRMLELLQDKTVLRVQGLQNKHDRSSQVMT